jgi:hypothetical protein
VSVTLLFLSFGAFSLLFWAYFRFRRPRAGQPRPPASVGAPSDATRLISRFDHPPAP